MLIKKALLMAKNTECLYVLFLTKYYVYNSQTWYQAVRDATLRWQLLLKPENERCFIAIKAKGNCPFKDSNYLSSIQLWIFIMTPYVIYCFVMLCDLFLCPFSYKCVRALLSFPNICILWMLLSPIEVKAINMNGEKMTQVAWAIISSVNLHIKCVTQLSHWVIGKN